MPYKKLTALLLCFVLLATSVSAAPAPESPVLEGLSAQVGHVDETWQGQNGKTVYLIRDAHDSVLAQKNIARIIDSLVQHQGVKTVYEEGYEGEVPTDLFFKNVPDAKAREQVSRKLLEELRIGGAEYAHINRGSWHGTRGTAHDFRLIGADSLSGHLENILDYRHAARAREEILSDLAAIQKEQERIIAQKFPPKAREWLKLKNRFEKDQLDLTEYVRRSVHIYLGLQGPPSLTLRYPQLTLFIQALESKNAAAIQSAKQIRGREFNHELRDFERTLSGLLLNQPVLERVFEDYQTIQLARKLALMELSPSDFADAQAVLKKFKMHVFAQFAAEQNSRTVVLSRRWEKKIQRAVRFYQSALARETAVSKRLREFAENNAEKNAALVFGGFHAPQLKEMLREQGFSYVAVDPVIPRISRRDQALYRRLMAEDERLQSLPARQGTGVLESPAALAKMARVLSEFEWAALGLADLENVQGNIARMALGARSEVRAEERPVQSLGFGEFAAVVSDGNPIHQRYPQERRIEVDGAEPVSFYFNIMTDTPMPVPGQRIKARVYYEKKPGLWAHDLPMKLYDNFQNGVYRVGVTLPKKFEGAFTFQYSVDGGATWLWANHGPSDNYRLLRKDPLKSGDAHMRWLIRRDMDAIEKIEELSHNSKKERWSQDYLQQHLRDRSTIGMVLETQKSEEILGYVVYKLHRGFVEVLRVEVRKDLSESRKAILDRMMSTIENKLEQQRRSALITILPAKGRGGRQKLRYYRRRGYESLGFRQGRTKMKLMVYHSQDESVEGIPLKELFRFFNVLVNQSRGEKGFEEFSQKLGVFLSAAKTLNEAGLESSQIHQLMQAVGQNSQGRTFESLEAMIAVAQQLRSHGGASGDAIFEILSAVAKRDAFLPVYTMPQRFQHANRPEVSLVKTRSFLNVIELVDKNMESSTVEEGALEILRKLAALSDEQYYLAMGQLLWYEKEMSSGLDNSFTVLPEVYPKSFAAIETTAGPAGPSGRKLPAGTHSGSLSATAVVVNLPVRKIDALSADWTTDRTTRDLLRMFKLSIFLPQSVRDKFSTMEEAEVDALLNRVDLMLAQLNQMKSRVDTEGANTALTLKYHGAVILSLETLLPGSIRFLESLIKTGNDKQSIIRFINSKRTFLSSARMTRALQQLLERIQISRGRRKFKPELAGYFKILDSFSWIDSAEESALVFDRLTQDTLNAMGPEEILALPQPFPEQLAVAQIEYLAHMIGIEETEKIREQSGDALKRLDLSMISRLQKAAATINGKGYQKISLFRGALKATLEGRYRNYIENEEQEDEQARNLAIHNRKSREEMTKQGVNADRWLGWTPENKMPSESWTYLAQQGGEAGETDGIAQALSATQDYLERVYAFPAKKEARAKMHELLKPLGLQFVQRDDKHWDLKPIPSQTGERPDWFLSFEGEGLEALKVWVTAQRDEALQTEGIAPAIPETWTHLIENIEVLQRRSAAGDPQKNALSQASWFRMSVFERNPGHDLFIGDYSSCCLGMNSGTYPHAMLERLTDEAMSVITVTDFRTGDVMAAAWLYLAEDGSLVIQNLEINSNYMVDPAMMDAVGDSMVRYAFKLGQFIGAKRTLLGMPGHGKFFGADDGSYVSRRLAEGRLEKINYGLKKLGGYFESEYYLDSAEKPEAFLVTEKFFSSKQKDAVLRSEMRRKGFFGGLDGAPERPILLAAVSNLLKGPPRTRARAVRAYVKNALEGADHDDLLFTESVLEGVIRRELARWRLPSVRVLWTAFVQLMKVRWKLGRFDVNRWNIKPQEDGGAVVLYVLAAMLVAGTLGAALIEWSHRRNEQASDPTVQTPESDSDSDWQDSARSEVRKPQEFSPHQHEVIRQAAEWFVRSRRGFHVPDGETLSAAEELEVQGLVQQVRLDRKTFKIFIHITREAWVGIAAAIDSLQKNSFTKRFLWKTLMAFTILGLAPFYAVSYFLVRHAGSAYRGPSGFVTVHSLLADDDGFILRLLQHEWVHRVEKNNGRNENEVLAILMSMERSGQPFGRAAGLESFGSPLFRESFEAIDRDGFDSVLGRYRITGSKEDYQEKTKGHREYMKKFSSKINSWFWLRQKAAALERFLDWLFIRIHHLGYRFFAQQALVVSRYVGPREDYAAQIQAAALVIDYIEKHFPGAASGEKFRLAKKLFWASLDLGLELGVLRFEKNLHADPSELARRKDWEIQFIGGRMLESLEKAGAKRGDVLREIAAVVAQLDQAGELSEVERFITEQKRDPVFGKAGGVQSWYAHRTREGGMRLGFRVQEKEGVEIKLMTILVVSPSSRTSSVRSEMRADAYASALQPDLKLDVLNQPADAYASAHASNFRTRRSEMRATPREFIEHWKQQPSAVRVELLRKMQVNAVRHPQRTEAVQDLLMSALLDPDRNVRRTAVEINYWPGEKTQAPPLLLPIRLLRENLEQPWHSIDRFGLPPASDDGREYKPAQTLQNKRYSLMAHFFAAARELEKLNTAKSAASEPWTAQLEARRTYSEEIVSSMLAWFQSEYPHGKEWDLSGTAARIVEEYKANPDYPLGKAEPLLFWNAVFLAIAQYQWHHDILKKPAQELPYAFLHSGYMKPVLNRADFTEIHQLAAEVARQIHALPEASSETSPQSDGDLVRSEVRILPAAERPLFSEADAKAIRGKMQFLQVDLSLPVPKAADSWKQGERIHLSGPGMPVSLAAEQIMTDFSMFRIEHASGNFEAMNVILGLAPLDAAQSEVRAMTDAGIMILRGGRAFAEEDGLEVLSVYDEEGRFTGAKPRSEAHFASDWHAVSQIYVFDSKGRLLLQKRPAALKRSPGVLQVSVSGHAGSEENPDAAALREGGEELGIQFDPQRLKKVTVIKKSHKYEEDAVWENREFVFIYTYQATDEEVAEMERNYNLSESESLWLVPADQIEIKIADNPERFSYSLRAVIKERPELWKILMAQGTEDAEKNKNVPKSVQTQAHQALTEHGIYARYAEQNAAKAAAVERITEFLNHENPGIRGAAYRMLRSVPDVAPFLLQLASGKEPKTAASAMLALSFLLKRESQYTGGLTESVETKEALLRKIEDLLFSETGGVSLGEERSYIEKSALQALGYLEHPGAADLFVRKLQWDLDHGKKLDSFIFETAAAADMPKRRPKILDWFERTQKDIMANDIPFGVSLFLDGNWVASHLDVELGGKLIDRFGYMDSPLQVKMWKARDYLWGAGRRQPTASEVDRLALQQLEAAKVLIRMMGVATLEMVTRYLAEPEDDRDAVLDEWKQQQSRLFRMLMPAKVRPLQPVSADLSPEGRLERDLFFGALRQADFANAEDKRETHPFGYEHREKHGGSFSYNTYDTFEKKWNYQVKAEAQVFGPEVPPEVRTLLLPFFAADAVSVEAEALRELREELAAQTLGRWYAIARLVEIREGKLVIKTPLVRKIQVEIDTINPDGAPLDHPKAVSEMLSLLGAHRPVWKYALLDPAAMSRMLLFVGRANIQPDKKWKKLSYGARSALKLYAYDLLRDASRSNEEVFPEWEREFHRISDQETRYRGVLPSLGMELQSSNVTRAAVYSWKQALEFFEIHSPERLRYGHIVETAFQPAWTPDPFLLAIPILHRMGLMGGKKYKQAPAFHISLAGNLGAEARWLAFPLFMFRGDKVETEWTDEERASSSAWVLSKGYIHLNKVNQKADPESEMPQFHTEIRTSRLANVAVGQDELLTDYEKFLPAVQLLGTALAAFKKSQEPDAKLTELESRLVPLWTEYQSALAVMVKEIPEMQSLIEADWYESTGDSKDPDLVQGLEIFKRMGAAIKYKRQNAAAHEAFAGRVKALFLDYAGRVPTLLQRSEVRIVPSQQQPREERELSHLGYLRLLLEEAEAQQLIRRPRLHKDVTVDVFQGQKVLNMGLETSRVTEKLSARNIVTHLRKHGIDAVGIDKQAEDDPARGIVRGRVEAMDFPANEFDAAVSVGLFDKVYIEALSRASNRDFKPEIFYRQVSQRLHSNLKNGARFYLIFYSEPNEAFLQALKEAGFSDAPGLAARHHILTNQKKRRSEVRSNSTELLSAEEQQNKLAHFLWEAAGAEPNQPLHWQAHIWDLAGALIDSGLFRDLDLTDASVKQLAHFIWLAKSGPGRSILQEEDDKISDWVQAHTFVNTTLRPWRDRLSPEAPGEVRWSTDTLAGNQSEDETVQSLDAMGLQIYQQNYRGSPVGGDFYRVVQSKNLRFSLVELADGTDHGKSAMQASWFSQAVEEAEAELGAPLLTILAENGGEAIFERVKEYLQVLQTKIDVITEVKRGEDHFGFYTYQLIFADHKTGHVYEWRGGHHPAVIETTLSDGSQEWIQKEPAQEVESKKRLDDVLLPLGWMLEGVSLQAVKKSSWQYRDARRILLYTDGAWAPSRDNHGLLGVLQGLDIVGQDSRALYETLQSRIENARERGTGVENDDVTFILFDLEKARKQYLNSLSLSPSTEASAAELARSEVRTDEAGGATPWAENRRPPFKVKPEEVVFYYKREGESDDRESTNSLWRNLPEEFQQASNLVSLSTDQAGLVFLTTNPELSGYFDSRDFHQEQSVIFEVQLAKPLTLVQQTKLADGVVVPVDRGRGRRISSEKLQVSSMEITDVSRMRLRIGLLQKDSPHFIAAAQSLGLTVKKMKREEVWGIKLNGLKPGGRRRSTWPELISLLSHAGVAESEMALVNKMYADVVSEEKEDHKIIQQMLRSTDFVAQVFEKIFARPDIPERLEAADKEVVIKDIRHIGEGGFKRVYRVGLMVPGETTDFGFVVKVVKPDVIKSDSGQTYDYQFLENVASAVTRLREHALYLHPPATEFLMLRDSYGRDRMVSAEGEVEATKSILTDGQRDRLILESYLTLYQVLEKQFVFDPKRANTVVRRMDRRNHAATLIDLDNLNLEKKGAYDVVQSFLDFGFKANDIIYSVIQMMGTEKGMDFLQSALFTFRTMGLQSKFRNAFDLYKNAKNKPILAPRFSRAAKFDIQLNGLPMRVSAGTRVSDLLRDFSAHLPTAVVFLNGKRLTPERIETLGSGRQLQQYYLAELKDADVIHFMPSYRDAGKPQSFDDKRRMVDDMQIRLREQLIQQGIQQHIRAWHESLGRIKKDMGEQALNRGAILRAAMRHLDELHEQAGAFLDDSKKTELVPPLSTENLDSFERVLRKLEFSDGQRPVMLARWQEIKIAGQALIHQYQAAISETRDAKAKRSEVRRSAESVEKAFREQPEFRKVMLSYKDLAENFTGENQGRLEELAVLAARYPEVRFHIYETDYQDSGYAAIRKIFKGIHNVKFQTQAGAVALNPSTDETQAPDDRVLHLSTAAFDVSSRFGVQRKKIRFMLTGNRRGALAASLLYNPEHWLFRSRLSRRGEFWVLKSTLARLGRDWLAGFVIASAA